MYSKNPHKLLRIMFKKNYVSLLFILFVFSSGLAQKGFYANSVTGNDPNLGLVGFPKKTFAAVFATASPGFRMLKCFCKSSISNSYRFSC